MGLPEVICRFGDKVLGEGLLGLMRTSNGGHTEGDYTDGDRLRIHVTTALTKDEAIIIIDDEHGHAVILIGQIDFSIELEEAPLERYQDYIQPDEATRTEMIDLMTECWKNIQPRERHRHQVPTFGRR